MVLERAGDDLGGARGAAVDQHDQRLAADLVAGPGIEPRDVLRVTAARRDDLAAIEEGVGHADRLIQQAARVEPQVENIALELVLGDLRGNRLDRRLQVVEGLLGEGGDLQVTDIVLGAEAHRANLDDVADDGDLQRLLGAFTQDGQLDRRVDHAAHLVDRLAQRKPADLLAVDLGDQVSGKNAGAGGRGLVDRRDDLDQLVLHRDLDAEAAELSLGLDAHVLRGLGIEIGRMRIERRQHPVDGAFDQRLLLGRRHILRAHTLEDVAEDRELLVGFRPGSVGGIAA